MKNWKNKIWMLALLLFTGSLQAQSLEKQKADQLYNKLSYASAIEWYLKALKKGGDDDITLKLAECYRLTNQYEKASEWYRKAVVLPDKPPIAVFYYAHTLLMAKDYRAAKEKFLEYARLAPQDKRGKRFAEGIDNIREWLKDSSRYEIKNMSFNSEQADFGAIAWQGGLIFASSRKQGTRGGKEFQWVDEPFLDLFFVAKADTGWSKPDALGGEINTKYHESNLSPIPNSSGALFTRNNYLQRKGTNEQGVMLLKIYSALVENGEGHSIEEFTYNNDNYSVCHPSVSVDGQYLYFVSDMPGGQGGKDIYRCRREGNGWGAPKNLGPAVNTPGDEMFPFIHRNGALYFSSNGHPGLGHLDLFSINLNGRDSTVHNLGGGINSPYDDFAIWVDDGGSEGFFSSNRKGGKGDDDIYSFRMTGAVVEIVVMDKVAKLPIENARISVKDAGTGDTFALMTDTAGRTLFNTELGRSFSSLVTTIEFDPHPLEMSTASNTGQTYFKYLVELYNPPPSLTAIVIDDATKERLPGSRIEMVYLPTKDTTERIADRNGRFSIKLGKEATYKMTVSQPGYLNYTAIVSTTELTYDGDTIIPLKMERIQFNKPIVLENIHYDFDMWFIRNDAKPDLDRLAKLMKDNPQLVVELSSHTDCRGSDEYNIVLSHKRALSARQYLVDQGVPAFSIIAKGYGETRLVNECDDDVPCDENRHFANRRTEFRIIGTIDGVDISNSVLVTREDPNDPPLYVPEGGAQVPTAASLGLNQKESAALNDPILPAMKRNEAKAGEVIFRVQLGAYNEEQSPEKLKDLFEYSAYAFFVKEGGYYKYMVGEYKDYRAALKAQMHLRGYGYNGAFVSAWRGDTKLSAQEMQKYMK